MADYIDFARRSWRSLFVVATASALAACASQPVQESAPAPAPAPAEVVEAAVADESSAVKRSAPLQYVVKKGDTLWDISEHFLKDPWLWTDVWHVNPQVENPHLIYPGDIIYLIWVDGQLRLSRTPGDGPPIVSGPELERITPQIRELPLDEAIPTIPIDAIREFLRGPRLVTLDELKRAPYVVEFAGEHIMGGQGMSIYAKNVKPEMGTEFNVVRLGQTYRDPESRDILGYEAIPVADAEVLRFGRPTTAKLVRTTREVLIGDRLLALEGQLFEANFFPKAPRRRVDGRIIAVFDGVSQIGQYQIIAINKGNDDGVEVGHVMSIYQVGRLVRDPMGGSQPSIQLPDQVAGTMMVFKTYDNLSYALVMEASRAIHIADRVDKPQRSN